MFLPPSGALTPVAPSSTLPGPALPENLSLHFKLVKRILVWQVAARRLGTVQTRWATGSKTEQRQMNDQTGEQGRTRGDFIQFGVIFFGFVLGATGIIANKIPGALLGLALMAEGLLYFLFRGTEME